MRIAFAIPDVPLEPICPHRLLYRLGLAGRGGPTAYADAALLENLILLIQTASKEYMQGKENVCRFWSTHDGFDIGSAMRASAHFEMCLSTTNSAINHVNAVKRRQRNLPKSRQTSLRNMSIFKGPASKHINNLRDAIQHKEKRILEGKISEGEPFAALLTGDEVNAPDNNTEKTISRIELGAHRIEFTMLAQAIKELRICGKILVDTEYGPSTR